MGSFSPQIQAPQGNQPVNPQPTQANYSPAQQQFGGGKTGASGNKVMYSPLSDQPTMGQPNPYPNTIGQWDNANIQPQPRQVGKGKGI